MQLPEPGSAFDYQLGGAYPPASDVSVISRDRSAEPVRDAYNVCYVNAFQAQPDAVRWWREHQPRLLLRHGDDRGLVVDEDWDEPLLDLSTRSKRAALLHIVGDWIDGCAASGFDAVEFDNLDSYERSHGMLTTEDAAAFARQLVRRAHASGLAAGQKNTAALLPQRSRIGFDFAVVEECARYGECEPFAAAYRDRVFDIEYRARDFARACRIRKDRLSFTLRDHDVLPAGERGHVSRRC